jgi:phosphonate transport system ATP-binding protein
MLEIRNLRVVYPNGFEALKSISLNVRDSEIVALIGRSGAGKSSLLRCINGLQPIASGSVILDEQDVSQLDTGALADLRRQIGFIWQEYNVVDRLSVMDNVLTGRLGHHRGWRSLVHFFDRTQREVALRSLERVKLLHRATQRADRLSGGEKQRVSIARALAQEPRLILADEPVASLDAELAWQVMHDLVSVSRDEGVPTLVTLHAVDLARAFADRVVGIAQGTVVFDGAPSQLDQAALDRIYRSGSDAPRVDLASPSGSERRIPATAGV